MTTPTATPSTATPRPGGEGRLGGRTVARIGYGAMQLERLHQDRAAAVALVRRAVDLGVDHVDTAEFYADGFVNGVLAEALSPADGVTVVSKVGADPNPAGAVPMRPAQRPEELRTSVEANLRSLRLEQVPVVNLRRMEGRLHIPVAPEQQVDLDDQLAVMTAMRDEGLIGAFGLSSISLDTLRRSLAAGPVCVQNDYNLLLRADEPLLELCIAHDIAWVPFFPLGGAFPGMAKVTEEPTVLAAAASLGVTPTQVGLAWLLHHAPNLLLIPGTATPMHLQENVAAGDVELDSTTLTAMDHLANS